MDSALTTHLTPPKLAILTSVTIFIGSILYSIFKSDRQPRRSKSRSSDRSNYKRKRKEYDSFVKLKKTFLSDAEDGNEDDTDLTSKNGNESKRKGKKCVFFSDYEVQDKGKKGSGKLEAEKQRMDDLYFAVFKKLES